MMTRILPVLTLLCFGFSVNAQNLDDFRRLESEGEIPKDFLELTIDKYKEDYKDNDNKKLDKEFFLSSRYFIDELLLSGRVLFNDPTTEYVERVAKNILRKDKALFKELRFYVLKSTVANAFSTDQGIIFVTTGLLASCENEAQLAYIIAHEVSHYTEHHVQKGYIEEQAAEKGKGEYRTQGYDERISQLSVYDKQMELEADQKGIDLYLQSTYAVDEIFSEFEMLLYSYLPFEDRQFDTTYLNTETLIIPGSYYPDTIVPISLEEDYDDKGSTHPNIQKRMDAAFDYLGEKKTKGDNKFVVSEEKFYEVRNLCRFENVNLHLINREYGEAIYTIYLLEKDFPDNKFLEFGFVKAWYGLTKHKNHGDFYSVAPKPKKVEGESHKLHALIRNLSREQMAVVALRYAIDYSKKYPEDKIAPEYVQDLKRELVAHSKFDYKELKSTDYTSYLSNLDDTLKTFDVEDSIKKVDDSDLSKYEKIKLKKKLRAMMEDSKNGNLGESEFHLFALSDVVADEGLIDELGEIKSAMSDEVDESLSYDEKKEIRKKGQRLGIDKIVVVDPFFENYKMKGDQDLAKSESKKLRVADMYTKKYSRIDLDVDLVDSKQLNPRAVDAYNEIGILYQWLSEVSEYESEMNMISSNRDLMLDLSDKHGTSHFVFTGIQMFKERNGFELWHLYTIMAVYTAPIALVDLIIPHNYFSITALSVDATKDKVEFAQSELVNLKGVDLILQAYIFDVLYQLNKEPKK